MSNRTSIVTHPRKCVECNHIQHVRNKRCQRCNSYARVYQKDRPRNVKRLGDI